MPPFQVRFSSVTALFFSFVADHIIEVPSSKGTRYEPGLDGIPLVIIPNFQYQQSEINIRFCCFSSEEFSKPHAQH